MQEQEKIDALKQILENLSQPSKLEDHPWTKLELVKSFNGTSGNSQKLLLTLANIFVENHPPNPPRKGKRLDTKWGQYGLLAAQYFVPILLEKTAPSSLRTSWEHMDEAIYASLEIWFGRPLTNEERELYAFTKGEKFSAPTSTLSDWQRTGLSSLYDQFWKKQNSFLSQPKTGAKKRELKLRKALTTSLIFLVTLLLLSFGIISNYNQNKNRVANLLGDITYRAIAESGGFDGIQVPEIEHAIAQIDGLGPNLMSLVGIDSGYRDRFLTWESAFWGYVRRYKNEDISPGLSVDSPSGGSAFHITESDPTFLLERKTELQTLISQLASLSIENLNSEDRNRLLRYQSILGELDARLDFLSGIPYLLGLGDLGARSYLVIIQDTDELRAAGGLIVAAGELLIQNGNILSFDIKDSYELDNPNVPAPQPPWQLKEYMAADSLQLRDAIWHPDFVNASQLVQELYAYTNFSAVDGILSLDRHAIKTLLEVAGPLRIQNQVIRSETVDTVWENALQPDESWTRFTPWWRQETSVLADLVESLITTIFPEVSTNLVLQGELHKLFREGHLIASLNEPELKMALNHWEWDGAIARGYSDFLMVIESNLGFNKVSQNTVATYEYLVDLSSPTQPSATLNISIRNTSSGGRSDTCTPGPKLPGEPYDELLNGCSWIYLRILTQNGTQLVSSDLPEIPPDWLLLGSTLDGHVDYLEEKDGGPGVGFFLVVPPGGTREATLEFLLDPNVITLSTGEPGYSLKLLKQLGKQGTQYILRMLGDGWSLRVADPAIEVLNTTPLELGINLEVRELYIAIEGAD